MSQAIAIIGFACTYPDARGPQELWQNVLGHRRAFRRIPAERLRLEDYYSEAGGAPDSTYSCEAALIDGYEFDRIGFRVGNRSFRSADMAHWLALDVASQALADAGYGGGEGLGRDSTGVIVGNTLTGEFTRAGLMRLRWPYVRRRLEEALAEEGWSREQLGGFLARFEASYKEPFPETTDESLAGGLSNTIAGRICNHFDLHGGGYTVDGACSSSLLALANACSALAAGDLDVALAGGVDLSLDPFELVGFARTRALSAGEMWVYDTRSAGFLPGEGCGFAVLTRYEDAIARGHEVYALIRGWGISSDGSGGLTRPEAEGQLFALRRAYRRAGYGIDTVALFEGHGTGTAVGDAVELAALNRARRESASDTCGRAAIGSIKANIGHTKAAAGLASLIKASMALRHQVLPPTTGCGDPHPEIAGEASTLRVLRKARLWPEDNPLRAGVSSMGFGGINCHVTLEGDTGHRRQSWTSLEQPLRAAPQDAELLLMAAASPAELDESILRLRHRAPGLSRAEVGDLAAELARGLPEQQTLRAAVVADSPRQFAERLDTLSCWLAEGIEERLDEAAGIFLGSRVAAPRIGLLFPGQGSPARLGGGLWRRRFADVDDLYRHAALPEDGDGVETELAQPAICTASLAALRVLRHLGVEATAAVGHSLGELAAFHWAGAFDSDALLRIAAARGRAMSGCEGTGAMASLGSDTGEVEQLLAAWPGRVAVTGYNTPRQTVVSGQAEAVDEVLEKARGLGFRATKLPVSHAFHSPLVAAAVPALADALGRERLDPLRRRVSSTVTGEWLNEDTDLAALLELQVTSPVRFVEAVEALTPEVDVFLEVGPGEVLTGLVRQFVEAPAMALDAGGASLRGLLQTVGALFALGAPLVPEALFADRFTRPFDLDRKPKFFANPCESAPVSKGHDDRLAEIPAPELTPSAPIPAGNPDPHETAAPVPAAPVSAEELVRDLIVRRTELPSSTVDTQSRLLSDLHLSSIAVGELVTDAARQLGLPPPVAPNEYADATVGEVAHSLEEIAATGQTAAAQTQRALPPGIDSWVRPFTVEWIERPLPHPPSSGSAPPGPSAWHIFAPEGNRLGAALGKAFSDGGSGVVLYVPPDPEEHGPDLLLEAARAALARPAGGTRAAAFVLAHHGDGAAGFARTLHLEAPEIPVTVVELPAHVPEDEADLLSQRVAQEAAAGHGYTEVRYGEDKRRFQPVLRLLTEAEEPDPTVPELGGDDVVLVTGGGKGIGAECALALARLYGVRLALLGRSSPEDEAELRANLERFSDLGATFRYLRADVTDPEAVRGAVAEAEAELGPVSAVVHSAGTNVPKLIETLERADFERTLAPKLGGLRSVLGAVDAGKLRLVVGFGSIIARTGLAGEADYAFANEQLRRSLEGYGHAHPGCRALCVEWSVWSGVGMGERLSRLDALTRQGITPIPPERGVEVLLTLLNRPTPVGVVVAGRFGEPPTLEVERPELPLLRFLERPRVFFPGVELVADCTISNETDPYLADHIFDGERLFPAVMGLEAMAQAWYALTGSDSPPVFHEIRFERPISVPEGAEVGLRLAAQVRRSGRLEVALRSERTDYRVDYFHAVLSAREAGGGSCPSRIRPVLEDEESWLPLEPRQDLYGGVLFQAGRFQRLQGYRHLQATRCLSEIMPNGHHSWFGSFLPAGLRLADPGMRDASIHSVQACIPHATVLPVGVERLLVSGQAQSDQTPHPGSWRVTAQELLREGRTLVYDLEVRGADGTLLERWKKLELRIVDEPKAVPDLAAPLLGPYLERRLHDVLPAARVSVVVESNGHVERRAASAHVLGKLLGHSAVVRRRPDGKPETADGSGVSIAHGAGLVVAVAGKEAIGCDVEPVEHRSEQVWRDLLGHERRGLLDLVARETGDDHDSAATRIWTLIESCKKAGYAPQVPLVFSRATADGWAVFSAGHHLAASVLVPRRGERPRLAFAVMVDNNEIGEPVA